MNLGKNGSGLEKIGGLREPEDLRELFIIPAGKWLSSVERGGPLIKKVAEIP